MAKNVSMADVMKLLQTLAAKETGPSKAVSKPTKLTKDEFLSRLIAACKKAGYADPVPYGNIFTYGGRVGKVGWLEKGRQVKRGEHSIKVGGKPTNLFHISQTEALSASVTTQNEAKEVRQAVLGL